jgi:hypothetical protein
VHDTQQAAPVRPAWLAALQTEDITQWQMVFGQLNKDGIHHL